MKVTTTYQGQLRFSSGSSATQVMMDAPEIAGGLGEAPTPKAMVLHGLAGCTGLDVAAILTKKKVPFEELSLDVEATQTRSAPKVFDTIKITYRLKADQEHREAVEKAIKLSEKHLCGVSDMLRKTATLTWELELLPLG